ncbi:MAG: aspartyl-tRNA(Asn)/glutamyl-tRNA(Gln) amidotransferase subunit [Solirubrobacteraceae bacterium]|nr:aspartyl-tRNA(Asn)/glutamyl-tRNA(Gln) amidotransferase subunit [Solirubrobacteraceae bacterium]
MTAVSDPADLTIGAARAELSAGRLSAVELLEAVLARIDAREPDVNAWIAVDRDGALEAARDVSGRPLAGIPVGVKDILDAAGLPTTAGAAGWVRHPGSDAAAVAGLRAAGAVVVGKNNTNEFAYGIDGRNPHHGDCRNPHDPDRVTGGSTSGTTAAVAAGMALGGVGSDTSGSLRTPASLCGTVGLRPTPGLVSRAGAVVLAPTYDTVGPVARTCADAALLLSAMAGRPLAPELPAMNGSDGRTAVGRPLSGVRVGVAGQLVERCEPYVVAGFDAALHELRALGAEVIPAQVEHLAHAEAVQLAIQISEAADAHADWFEDQAPRYAPDVRDRLEAGRLLPPGAADTARRAHRLLQRSFAAAMDAGRLDALAAPATPVVAPRRDAGSVEVAGRALQMRDALMSVTLPLTQTGGPVLALPIARHEGLPFGMQLAGRPGTDPLLLGIGAAYEAATA